jgi:hypothetical protein
VHAFVHPEPLLVEVSPVLVDVPVPVARGEPVLVTGPVLVDVPVAVVPELFVELLALVDVPVAPFDADAPAETAFGVPPSWALPSALSKTGRSGIEQAIARRASA